MPVPAEIQELCRAVAWPPDETRVDPATDQQIESAEKYIGILFPTEWREFLRFLNGPCIGPGGILGIETKRPALDLRYVLDFYRDWKDQLWIPIAGDGCGNFYVLAICNDGTTPVCFIDTIAAPNTLAFVVSSDLWHFLVFILSKELGEKGWPFLSEYVLRNDPKLAECAVAPMPWST